MNFINYVKMYLKVQENRHQAKDARGNEIEKRFPTRSSFLKKNEKQNAGKIRILLLAGRIVYVIFLHY